jgi:cephalosporin hydroxylase/glycosyltransferase involved in cell wall biosynthesis
VDNKNPTGDPGARAIRRYLDLLRDALLDEHYVDNELRIEHLLDCVSGGKDVDFDKLANPTRHMGTELHRLERKRETGELPTNEAGTRSRSDALAYAGLGRVRLNHLERCLEVIREEAIEGDLVESGTGRGGAAILMRGFLEAYELPDPRVWVADRFDGRGSVWAKGGSRFPPDLNTVREAFDRFGLLDRRVVFLQGPPSQTLAEASIGEVALLRVDSNDAEEIRAVLDALYDRVTPGGFVIVDAYGAVDCNAAVDGFRAERDVVDPLERIDWSGAAWRKTPNTARRSPGAARSRAMHAGPESRDSTGTKDLSVVLVVYNMHREAARTLHSLSRSYQREVGDLDYEVIVVENGSEPEQRLGEEFVRSFGAEFRYIDLGDEATPSPVRALNRGIAASSGRNVALMIDAAHMLTPGVLHWGMLGLSTYKPAIVIAKQWYVGPGQQPEAVEGGYSREFEDRLLNAIDWPTDGYRLFEISHFIGDRDWFDPEWESNCIFVPRLLLEQAGAMDENFSAPGGGFANLDFFERMVCTPGVTLVTMLGEGSFHQLHGGTTTNVADPHKLIKSYDDEYKELRGRRFRVPPQLSHYIGTLPPSARRTKLRRMIGFQHFRDAHSNAANKRPSRPMPVPQDLRREFMDAFWRSGEWHRTTWLGKRTHRTPTDLLAYQELIFRVRPEWIIETRTGAGGRALFLASICDLIGSGQVLSIDSYPLANPPEHPRITYVSGDPAAERTAAEVRQIVGEQAKGLLILGGAGADQVTGAFRNFSFLVPVGSYVVVEDTILDGNVVWPGFGVGPSAAVTEIIDEREFVADRWLERGGLTFNAGGFLKRVR